MLLRGDLVGGMDERGRYVVDLDHLKMVVGKRSQRAGEGGARRTSEGRR
jgi:hypothetical protein